MSSPERERDCGEYEQEREGAPPRGGALLGMMRGAFAAVPAHDLEDAPQGEREPALWSRKRRRDPEERDHGGDSDDLLRQRS